MKIFKDAEGKLFIEKSGRLIYLSCSDHEALKADDDRDSKIKLIKSGDNEYYKYMPTLEEF